MIEIITPSGHLSNINEICGVSAAWCVTPQHQEIPPRTKSIMNKKAKFNEDILKLFLNL